MAGDFYLISSQTLTSDTATITFSSLPTTFSHLQVLVAARTARTGNDYDGDWIYVRFNNDTSTSYNNVNLVSALNSANGANLIWDADTNNATGLKIGRTINSSETDTKFRGASSIFIPNYTSTTFNKVAYCIGGSRGASLASRITSSAGTWTNTAAITAVTITASYDYKTGSRIDLYGMKTA